MLARAQQAQVDILEGKDPIDAILEYARASGITQIFVGHNLRRTWRTRLGGTPAGPADPRRRRHRRPRVPALTVTTASGRADG